MSRPGTPQPGAFPAATGSSLPTPGHTLRQWLTSLGFLAALTFLMFADVLFTTVPIVLSNGAADLSLEYSHWRAFGFSELRQGNLALWNPCLFSGAPFFGGAQAALLYPFNALFLFLPLHHAINWSIALHVFLAGAFTYAWAARRGLRVPSCLLSAVIYMFCGANFLHIYSGYLSFLCGLVWAPLLFLAIDGLFESPSLGWSLLGMFAVAMQVLAGNPQSLFYTAVAAALYCVLCAFRSRPRRPVLLGLAGVVMGGVALSAIQLFAGFQEWGEMLRSSGVPFQFAAMFSFPPENFLTLLAPHLFGDLKTVSYWGRHYLWEMSLFISLSGLVLAVVGAIWGDRRTGRSSMVMVLLLLLLALGAYTPLFKLLYAWVPGFNKFRGNSKFIFLASLFLALLAGLGLDELIRGRRLPRAFLMTVAIISLLSFSGAVIAYSSTFTTPAGKLWQSILAAVESAGESYLPGAVYHDPAFVLGAARLAARSLLIAAGTLLIVVGLLWWQRKSRAAVGLLLLLAVVELLAFGRLSLDHFDLQESVNPAIKAFLAEHPGDYRIANLDYPNTALSFCAQDVWGYEPGIVLRYAQLLAFAQGLPADEAVKLTTTHNVFWPDHPLLEMLRCRFLFHEQGGKLAVYERTNYLPHVLLVQRCRILKDRDQILSTLTNADFNPRSEIILEIAPDPAPVVSAAAGSVRLTDSSTDELTIEADLPSPNILLVPDVYAEGWRARGLPGSAQSRYRIQPGNWCLRAIPLAAGHHHLRLEYAPPGFRLGRWISLIFLPVYLCLIALTVRRIARLGWFQRAWASPRMSQGSRSSLSAAPDGSLKNKRWFTEEGWFQIAVVTCLAGAVLLAFWPRGAGGDPMKYGETLLRQGRLDEAIAHFQKMHRGDSGYSGVHQSLAVALLRKGRLEEAIGHLRSAVQNDPKLASAQNSLGSLLLQRGQFAEAIGHYRAAIAAQPTNSSCLNNLAWVLATCPQDLVRDGAQAVQLAQQADRLSGGRNPSVLGTLAAAYAEVGRMAEAVSTAQRALDIAAAQTNSAEINPLRSQVEIYRAGFPFRDTSQTNVAPHSR
ncbi:MAG: tetratricopeptide repeat protein [Verrucomicrobiota bacterium]